MIKSLENKTVVATEPAAIVNNAAVASAPVDTKGFDHADVNILVGSTDAAFTVLKLQESDDNATWTDVPNADYSVPANNVTLPSGVSDNEVFAFHCNLLGRKRYLKVLATVGNGANGAYVAIVYTLSRPRESPNTAAKRGVTEELFV